MRTFDVKILGQRYKVKSDDSEEYIGRLADFVNDNISEVQKSSKTVSTHSVAILAALSIADKLLKVEEANNRLHLDLREKIKQMITIIRSKRESAAPQ